MSIDFMKWAVLSGSDRDPVPGDLVRVMPIADMAGYVLCGAVYIGHRRVDVFGEGTVFGGRPSVIHDILYNGSVMVISGHSHRVEVIDDDG